jgi:hypothetical protein
MLHDFVHIQRPSLLVEECELFLADGCELLTAPTAKYDGGTK